MSRKILIKFQAQEGQAFSMSLRLMRRRLDLSQGDVGKAIGVSYQTINTWENDPPEKIQKEKLEKLSSFLHTTIEEMLTGGDKAQSGEEVIKEKSQHSDTSSIDKLRGGGTGMYTIGDMVQFVLEFGTAQDRKELMFAKKKFIDWTSKRIDEIEARDSSKKNKAV